MLAWSWGRWPDVLVDFGRELYVPWQLASGKVLYVDIAYFNGPLSPYWNALWFHLFGVGLRTLVIVNLAVIAGVLVLLNGLLSRIGGQASATVGCLVFVTVFAFGQLIGTGNYNFVCPYSHEMTHGLALSLGALWFVARWHDGRRTRHLIGCGVCLGLVLLTKPEIALADGAAVAVGLAPTLVAERRRAVRLAAFMASLATPPTLALVLLARRMPLDRAALAVAGAWPLVFRGDLARMSFYKMGMGIDDPVANLWVMLPWLGVYALLTAVVGGPGLAARGPRGRRAARVAALALGVLATILAWRARVANWFSGEAFGVWFHAAKPLPVVMLLLAVGVSARLLLRRQSSDAKGIAVLRLSMLVLALALLGKIALNARIYHYGFVLAMPATLLVIVALVDWLPDGVARWGGDRGACRIAALGLVIAAVTVELRVVQHWFAAKTTPVGTGADRFLADGRGPFVNDALAALATTRPDASVTAFPAGVMLDYLARRVDPVPYIEFSAPGLAMFGEGRVLAALEARPPDYVMLVHYNPAEVGFFGRDYGTEIFAWLRDHYRPVRLFGAPPLLDERFGIVLAERVDAGDVPAGP